MKFRLLFVPLLAVLTAPLSKADIILSLFPDNNQSAPTPLTLQGFNGETKNVGFKVENTSSYFVLFNTYNQPSGWTDVFFTLPESGNFLAPNTSFTGIFGTYTFPATGVGIVTTHTFNLEYTAYDDPDNPTLEINGTALDAQQNAPAITFEIIPSTEPPPQVIPEPSTFVLIGASSGLLLLRRLSGRR